MSSLDDLKKEINKLADQRQASILQNFFKTAKGEYGEGDVFLGIRVPQLRKQVDKFKDLSLKDIKDLLSSQIHEYRMISLLILLNNYKNSDFHKKGRIYKFYLKNSSRINSWDLVDASCPGIVGDYLLNRPRDVLYKLARSRILWRRRIAVVSTLTFIKQGDFKDIYKLAEMLLDDKHDLIHKAVGWMLREAGKRNQKLLEKFLGRQASKMPRVMLRYAIEKFSKARRKHYLAIK